MPATVKAVHFKFSFFLEHLDTLKYAFFQLRFGGVYIELKVSSWRKNC